MGFPIDDDEPTSDELLASSESCGRLLAEMRLGEGIPSALVVDAVMTKLRGYAAEPDWAPTPELRWAMIEAYRRGAADAVRTFRATDAAVN